MAFAIELQKPNKKWFPLERSGCKIELPPNTLLLAERVQEYVDEVVVHLFNDCQCLLFFYFTGKK